MTDVIAFLETLLESNTFLKNLDTEGIDKLLDDRDAAPFDVQWCRVDGHLAESNADQTSAIQSLREAAFKRAFQITESPDASGYISDDFGMLATASQVGFSDPWLAALLVSYVAGNLPHGDLPAEERLLNEIANPLAP